MVIFHKLGKAFFAVHPLSAAKDRFHTGYRPDRERPWQI
jgi:hypothetical protein